jgi:putative two-component system response regulator
MQHDHGFKSSSYCHLVAAADEILVPSCIPSGANVVIVDDDEQVRELLEDLLVLEGLNVLTAANGQDSLEVILGSRPDLVLLDVQLPLLDGFEVCRRIKANPDCRFTPVVLITGLSAAQDRIRGIEAGADDFLTKPIDRHQLLARVKSLLTLKSQIDELERAETVLFALAQSIEAKDPYTEGHCERLATLSADLGQRVGLSAKQVKALSRAGIVHDIGKVAVPDNILLKPGKLSEDEWAVMRKHPLTGEEICRPLKSFRSVLPIIRHHHEKLDGSGYPDGLAGDAIPLTARVLQIVDVYDALTTSRPYKLALSRQQALKIMWSEVERGWWDAAILQEFQALLNSR